MEPYRENADSIIKHWEYLRGKQANFRQLWNVVAQFVMPGWDNFVGDLTQGLNRNSRLFDSTAVSANERFAAAMEWMLTPRTQVWHGLEPQDERLADDPEVQKQIDMAVKIMFSTRYQPTANYASQTDECYMSLGAFGNNGLFIDENLGKGIRYRSAPLSELVWALDHSGMVDTVYREFEFTPKQAMQQWGEKNLPEEVRTAYEKSPFQDLKWLHCTRPNGERTPGKLGPGGMKFSSWYIYLPTREIIETGGFRTFPWAIGRYRMAPREQYGRSPAVMALPHIRTLNEMSKTVLRAGQKAVDPPILLQEEGLLTPFNQRPGAANYGMLSADGVALAQPLASVGKFDIGHELMEREGTAINDAFLVSLFQILVQNPEMTATEALIRAQEKGIMIAPAMGRQQSEFLGPQIVRELDIHVHAGLIDESFLENVKPTYTSPLTRLMRAEEGTSIMNTVQSIAQLAQLDPSAAHVLDVVDAAREMAMINRCPAKLLRTDEQIQEMMQAQAQQAQEAQLTAAGPAVSQSALNLAKAQQALTGTGGAQGQTAA